MNSKNIFRKSIDYLISKWRKFWLETKKLYLDEEIDFLELIFFKQI